MAQSEKDNIKSRNDAYKLIAIISMLIDHIGTILLNGNLLFYGIGRLAFPLFAYQLSISYKKTSNLKKYILRLIMLALISQKIYFLVWNDLNIFFTLTLGLIVIYLYDNQKIVLGVIIVITSIILPINYSFYGVLLPLTFYLFMENTIKLIISQTLLLMLYFIFGNLSLIQFISLFVILLLKMDLNLEIFFNKYFYYAFYPMHIIILLFLKLIL